MNALAEFFSPEAGQRRRNWLSGQEERVGNALRYYLGPDLFPPVNALANGAAMISPGADVQDAYQASGEMMAPGRSALDRAGSGAALAASIGAMLMPGGVSSLRQGFDDVVDAGVRAYDPAVVGANAGNVGARSGRDYPTAPRDEWYGNANYEATGGRIETMTPQEFLYQVRPLELDDVAEDNIDDLMNHIQSGRTLDPLQISAKGREDGRHRAYAAMRLGIDRVPVLRWGADTPAQNIANLLREGRASEVTDDMMGALDPNDSMELMRLYEAGATGADMPMDTASRMARAEGMGFDTDAYHATRATEDFPAFRGGARGSIYMAATPEAAARGAIGQALENPYAPPGAQSVTATLPLNVRSSDIDGLSVNAEAWRALPEMVDGDEALRALQPRIEGVGAQYWDDVYLSQPRGEGFRYYRNDPPEVSYADLEPGHDVFGYRLPGWNSGSDVPSLNARAERGQSGFLVSDEAGSSIVASPSMPIRSKFARFDPRLSHLSNLNAGVAGAAAVGAGALAMQPGQAEAQSPLPPELSFLEGIVR